MCVSMYVCIYVCVYQHICVCVYIYIYIYIYMCVSISAQVASDGTHNCAWMLNINICMCVYICMCVSIHVCIYICPSRLGWHTQLCLNAKHKQTQSKRQKTSNSCFVTQITTRSLQGTWQWRACLQDLPQQVNACTNVCVYADLPKGPVNVVLAYKICLSKCSLSSSMHKCLCVCRSLQGFCQWRGSARVHEACLHACPSVVCMQIAPRVLSMSCLSTISVSASEACLHACTNVVCMQIAPRGKWSLTSCMPKCCVRVQISHVMFVSSWRLASCMHKCCVCVCVYKFFMLCLWVVEGWLHACISVCVYKIFMLCLWVVEGWLHACISVVCVCVCVYKIFMLCL
jgi:hypothetical protein